MRCETSFFSLTLYKKLLTRYWPMWAVWLVIWLSALPISLLNASDAPPSQLSRMAADFAHYTTGASLAITFAAIIVAVGVFFYLFKGKAMTLMGALPLRREGLFATACAAGLSILLFPLVAVVLVTIPVEAALGCLNVPALLKFLGGCALTGFFWFSFAALCCVISGSAVVSAAFYFIFNGVVSVMFMLLDSLCDLFFYGFGGFPYAVGAAVDWCTPAFNLFRSGADWWERAWIYAGVGFLMLLAALGLHHIRRAERTGDLVSFTALRYAFKVCVILCGGLSLGMLFTALFFGRLDIQSIGLPLTLCCCAAAVLCAFVAEMLLKKTFRVWKSWRWAAAAALAFALGLAVPQYDLIGYVDRVPAPDRVTEAVASFSGAEISSLASGGLVYRGEEAVTALERLHRYALEHRRGEETPGEYMGSYRVELSYTLKSGFTLTRSYSFSPGDSPQGHALVDLIHEAVAAGKATFTPPSLSPSGGAITWNNGDYSTGVSVEAPAADDLLAAVMEDVEAGRYAVPVGDPEPAAVILTFYWEDIWGSSTRQNFYCSPSTTATNAAVTRLYPSVPDQLVLPDTEALGGGEEIVD